VKSKSTPTRAPSRIFNNPLVSPYKGEDKIILGGVPSKKIVKKTLFESTDSDT